MQPCPLHIIATYTNGCITKFCFCGFATLMAALHCLHQEIENLYHTNDFGIVIINNNMLAYCLLCSTIFKMVQHCFIYHHLMISCTAWYCRKISSCQQL